MSQATERKRRAQQRPEDAAVYHRIHAVIADVTSAANAKADRRMMRAQRLAAELRRAAEWVRDYMNTDAAEVIGEMSGPRAVKFLHSFCDVEDASTAFAKAYRGFVAEHGTLVDGNVRAAIEEFLTWVPRRGDELRSRVKTFREEYEASLKADRDHLRDVAQTWSVVDGDGLGK